MEGYGWYCFMRVRIIPVTSVIFGKVGPYVTEIGITFFPPVLDLFCLELISLDYLLFRIAFELCFLCTLFPGNVNKVILMVFLFTKS